MGNFVTSFSETLALFKRDKLLIGLATIPVFIGLILYYFIGQWLFVDLLEYGRTWIENYFSTSGWTKFFYWMLVGFLVICFYFIVSWFFVLLVSVFASPFNDLISKRVEAMVLNDRINPLGEQLSGMFQNILFTVFNEVKKLFFILLFTTFAWVLSLVPLLTPISFFLSALLMCASYLDYSWSRHNFRPSRCLSDLKDQMLMHTLAGLIFFALVAIPIINVVSMPIAVVYFSRLFSLRAKARSV